MSKKKPIVNKENFIKRLLTLGVLAIACLSSPLVAQQSTARDDSTQEMMETSEEPGAVIFIPPSGWKLADAKILPPSVKAMIIGKGKYDYPPSINLATEHYIGTTKSYLKIVKTINEGHKTPWKDLGMIQTEAGNANLSQVDVNTEWGIVRMMHVILVKNETAYILTAAALKDEFPAFYKDFFISLRSLQINKDAFELVSSAKQRAELEKNAQALGQGWLETYAKGMHQFDLKNEDPKEDFEIIFNSNEFQQQFWLPFVEKIDRDFVKMGAEWKNFLFKQIKGELQRSAKSKTT